MLEIGIIRNQKERVVEGYQAKPAKTAIKN